MIEFTLTPDDELKQLSVKLQQAAQSAPQNLQNQLRDVSQAHRMPPPGHGMQPSRQPDRSFRQERASGQGAVGAVAGDIEGELGELSSGRFSGIFERRIQGAQSALDAIKDKNAAQRRQMQSANTAFAGSAGEQNALSGFSGSRSANALKSLRVEKLELSVTAARALGGAIAKSTRAGGGLVGRGVMPSMGMGAAGGGQSTGGGAGALGGALTGAGASTVIPGLGLALGAAGASMKLLSSASGMYQNLMQGQQGTLGTMQFLRGSDEGLVVPGGLKAGDLSSKELRRKASPLVRNAELAQIHAARARLSGSGRDTGGSTAGIQFGLAQGMGGLGGATLFSELGRYGQGGGAKMQSVMGAAQLGGMGGLRQGEFFRQLSGMASQGVSAGFGRMDLPGVGATMAGLGQGGLMGERAMSLTRSMHGQFQQRGSMLNSLALAGALETPGTSIVKAMAQAEKGATRGNIQSVSKLLGLGDLDKESRQLLEMNIFGATATDVMSARGGIAGAATSVRDEQLSLAGGQALGTLQGRVTGQEYIRTQNVMDSLASTLDKSFELQQNIARKVTGVMQKVGKAVDSLSETINKLVGYL